MKINPKLMTISVLSSLIVLLLSGCSSAPSIEDEAKLLEYESCLAAYRGQLIENLNRYEMGYEKEDELINGNTKYAIEKCSEFRP